MSYAPLLDGIVVALGAKVSNELRGQILRAVVSQCQAASGAYLADNDHTVITRDVACVTYRVHPDTGSRTKSSNHQLEPSVYRCTPSTFSSSSSFCSKDSHSEALSWRRRDKAYGSRQHQKSVRETLPRWLGPARSVGLSSTSSSWDRRTSRRRTTCLRVL